MFLSTLSLDAIAVGSFLIWVASFEVAWAYLLLAPLLAVGVALRDALAFVRFAFGVTMYRVGVVHSQGISEKLELLSRAVLGCDLLRLRDRVVFGATPFSF